MNNVWESSSGVKVTILPFQDHGWGFQILKMHEIVGGEVATGSIGLMDDSSSEAAELVEETQKIDISIENPEGRSMKISQAIITNKVYKNNYLLIEFACIPDKNFNVKPQFKTWDSIDTAFKSLWPGVIDKRCDSQIGQGLKIIQKGETDHKLLRRLAYSYKEKTVFAFGLTGFMIKDLPGIDSMGKTEPFWTIMDGKDEEMEGHESINYNPEVYLPIDDISTKSINMSSFSQGSNYRICSKDTFQLSKNFQFNTNLMNSSFYRTIRTAHTLTLPDYQLGDVLKYVRRDDPETGNSEGIYFVSEMTYFISSGTIRDPGGAGFVVHSILRGLSEKGKLFNEIDPYDTI